MAKLLRREFHPDKAVAPTWQRPALGNRNATVSPRFTMYPLRTCGAGFFYGAIHTVLSAGVSPSGACRCTETAALTLRESKSESAAGTVQARSSSKSLPCRVKFKVLRLLSGPFPPLHSSSLAYQLKKENKSFLVPGPSARPTRSLSRTHFIREQGLSHQQSHVRPPSHEGSPALLGGSGTRRDPSSEFPQQGDPHAHHGFVPGPCSAPPESRPNSHAAIITVIDSKTGIPETCFFFFHMKV